MVSVPCKEAIEVIFEVYEPLRVESTPSINTLSQEGIGGLPVKGLMIF
jgi:hypothetical protein